MKQGTPPEPVIAYDHTGTEEVAHDPGFRKAGRILMIAECVLLLALVVAMINLY